MNLGLDNIESAMNAGQDIVGGELCDHYAFRQDQVDWQIWIATGSRPLPRKLVITSRANEARPQSVTQYRWNLIPKLRSLCSRSRHQRGHARQSLFP